MSLALPGISRRRHVWGEVWREFVAVCLGGLLLAAQIADGVQGYRQPGTWIAVDVTVGVVALVLLQWRRRWPLGVCVVLTAFSAVSVVSAAASCLALTSLATHRRWRQTLLCCAEALVAGFLFEFFFPNGQDDGLGEWITTAVIGALAVALCVAIGWAIGARRQLVANLRTQLAVAEDRQHLRVEQARVAERARIAREMHDVLAHRISVVAMHSGALSYRTNLSQEELRASTAIISDNAHAALTELREVLGVLRDPTALPQGPDAPQPTLGDLPELVAGLESTDGPVEFSLPDDLTGLTELTSRNAYRIVQEGLTNRRKHAPGQPMSIVIVHEGDDLRLTMRNAMSTVSATAVTSELPDSGLGLVGATERAELVGGELTSGRDRADNFVVRARLPWPRDDS
ncbi:two-component sensor histidine kinase [Flexivirga endophytica]|uniref:histidine kinase n=1 Tax=Flexivirga endophytica TaxID=1849103 RepID=A0A916WQA1_9MICO|nr:histidine kinase [Flexivirga endophytica]GGB20339.1 two-component sensor histidine kinase [Flexivirga endophytica]GHB71120.1 two-component sensor histidine kinase [Flexivirga endophytica]